MTEQLAFQQVLRHGRTIQRDQRLILSAAQIHHGARHQFLPRSGTSPYQHRGIAGRHLADLFIHLEHSAAIANQFARISRQKLPQFFIFRNQGGMFLMRLEAGSQSIPNNIAYNLQQFLIPFQVGVPVHGTVNAQRADDLLQMNDGNADEGYFFTAFARASTVQEPGIPGNILNHMGPARFRHMPRNAFPHMVMAAFHFLLVQAVGGFNHQIVPAADGERAAQHFHAAVKHVQNMPEQSRAVAFIDNGGADFFQHDHLQIR